MSMTADTYNAHQDYAEALAAYEAARASALQALRTIVRAAIEEFNATIEPPACALEEASWNAGDAGGREGLFAAERAAVSASDLEDLLREDQPQPQPRPDEEDEEDEEDDCDDGD